MSHVHVPEEDTMHHISYELALTRRDELIRDAARRRLVSHSLRAMERPARQIPQWRVVRRRRRQQLAIGG